MGEPRPLLGGRRRKARWIHLRMGLIFFVVFMFAATVVRGQEQVELEDTIVPETKELVKDEGDSVVEEESTSNPVLSTPESSISELPGVETIVESETAEHATSSYEPITETNKPVHPKAESPASSYNPVVEAEKAYKQALHTLSSIPSFPSSSQSPPSLLDASSSSSHHHNQPVTLFSTLFPNQQGPIASIIRIIHKLRQQSWVPGFLRPILSLFGIGTDGGGGIGGGLGRRKEEEMKGRAVKVIDLLEHAVELGHMDALYTLAHISLFHVSPLLYNPTRAYESYSLHAKLTGNATSQSILAFFHATGYDDVTKTDQSKALLYYTFAAHGGDQGSQMALGYRYWAGIGVNDDCGVALEWYERAAEQSMTKFLSGPPGGRTLLHTTTRLSDLDGGVYGPGASVASTGPNAHRAVIKAASARQAGETWEDVLEYYMFNADRGETDFAYRLGKIFYQGSIYALLGGAASGGEGVGAIPRDYHRARYYFLRIARQIWPRDPPHPSSTSPSSSVLPSPLTPPVRQELKDDGTLQFAISSAGYIGRMYLRGEGVKQDYWMARLWFERGAEWKDRECLNGLGIMWRDGLIYDGGDEEGKGREGREGRKDLKKAIGYFMVAASFELAEAQVNLGKYNYYKGDLKLATTYFESAIRHGSPYEPYYYLAKIHSLSALNPNSPPHHVQGSCAMAVSFFKLVAERGAWEDDPVRDGEARWWWKPDINTMEGMGVDRKGVEGMKERAKEDALLRWWIGSERGSETAQNNLAYILDQDKSVLRFTRFSPFKPSNKTARLALTQYMRSAYQRNVDALVKVGDYYFHGLGLSDSDSSGHDSHSDAESGYENVNDQKGEAEGELSFEKRAERAAAFYQSAVDTQVSALAMWNLGWMYENGVGVPQDFHLAKRHYDLALETNSEAYLPVVLSLIKLHVRSIWHTLMGGQNGLALWPVEEQDTKTQNTLTSSHERDREQSGDLPAPPNPNNADPRSNQRAGSGGGDEYSDDVEDAQWYKGKARDDHRRRMRLAGGADAGVEEEEDPIEWARERRLAEERERERDRDGGEYDFGPEDYFDAAIRHPGRRDHPNQNRQNHQHTHAQQNQHQHQRIHHHRQQHLRDQEEDLTDDFAETMILVVLCLLVSVLMYIRGQWFERRRREEEERRRGDAGGVGAPVVGGVGGAPVVGGGQQLPPQQQQQRQNVGGMGGAQGGGVNQGQGGLFPPEGDPARAEWDVLQ